VPTGILPRLAALKLALPLDPVVIADPTGFPFRKKLIVAPLGMLPPAVNCAWAVRLTVPPKVPVAVLTVVVVGGAATTSVPVFEAVPG
jgi:hypothetical protein